MLLPARAAGRDQHYVMMFNLPAMLSAVQSVRDAPEQTLQLQPLVPHVPQKKQQES